MGLKVTRSELYSIYMAGLDEDAGYYAREAEESGLLAVYKAGVEAGQRLGVVDVDAD